MKYLAVCILLFFSANSFSCDVDGKTGYFPNDIELQEGDAFSNITEEDFLRTIAEFQKFWTPIVESMGRKLKFTPKWKKKSVNAMTRLHKNTFEFIIYGGLVRHQEASLDGLSLVLCHELGHHLGGAPKEGTGMGRPKYMTNEGQADYYASLKCFRKLYEKKDNVTFVAGLTVPKVVTEKCHESFQNESDVALCVRSANASYTMAKISGLSGLYPSFDRPDRSETMVTIDQHPQPQCRLDTSFSGSLCQRDHMTPIDNQDTRVGACNRVDGDEVGVRPRCWYNPI